MRKLLLVGALFLVGALSMIALGLVLQFDAERYSEREKDKIGEGLDAARVEVGQDRPMTKEQEQALGRAYEIVMEHQLTRVWGEIFLFLGSLGAGVVAVVSAGIYLSRRV